MHDWTWAKEKLGAGLKVRKRWWKSIEFWVWYAATDEIRNATGHIIGRLDQKDFPDGVDDHWELYVEEEAVEDQCNGCAHYKLTQQKLHYCEIAQTPDMCSVLHPESEKHEDFDFGDAWRAMVDRGEEWHCIKWQNRNCRVKYDSTGKRFMWIAGINDEWSEIEFSAVMWKEALFFPWRVWTPPLRTGMTQQEAHKFMSNGGIATHPDMIYGDAENIQLGVRIEDGIYMLVDLRTSKSLGATHMNVRDIDRTDWCEVQPPTV